MEIRDNRAKEWFWLDNEYLNGYAKHLGVMCTNVYISLCRHAHNETQTCFPSMEQIGEEIGVKRNAVSRAIGTLKEWNIISIQEGYDPENKRRKNNVYTLLSKSEWKEKPCTPKVHGKAMHSKSADPCTPNDESHAPERCSNYTHTNNTQLTRLSGEAASRAFRKPTVEQIAAYCEERSNTVSPQRFFDHYESNGWKIGGKSAMKDWKAAIRTWESNGYGSGTGKKDDKPIRIYE